MDFVRRVELERHYSFACRLKEVLYIMI